MLVFRRKTKIKKEKIIYILLLAVIISLFTPSKTMGKNYNLRGQVVKNNEKIVFLTFDDGPSANNTLRILNILNKHNVKGSFFVVGSELEKYPNVVKELKNSDMCILPHSYSHNYKVIYKDTKSFFYDLNKCNAAIEKVTGEKAKNYVRLPGGSDNLVSNAKVLVDIRNKLISNGIDYVDWNVCSGDAISRTVDAKILKKNVINQCSMKDFAVILMHDGYYKTTTVDALSDTIEYLKENNFKFRTFDDLTIEERKKMIQLRLINRK